MAEVRKKSLKKVLTITGRRDILYPVLENNTKLMEILSSEYKAMWSMPHVQAIL